MLWPRTASPIPTTQPDVSPNSDELRRVVLQASWARDRRVARRRLAARWVQWALWRYVLPAILVLGAAALVWSWLLPEIPALLVQGRVRSEPERPPVASPPVVTVPSTIDTSLSRPQTDIPVAGAINPHPNPLELRFETGWGAPRTPDLKADPAEAQSLPTLKPENWLHSKEP
jgi:hypothetical protein